MRPLNSIEHLSLISQFLTRYRAVRRFPYLSQEQIGAYQLRRVRRLVQLAYDHTPFYRRKYAEVGIAPRDIRSWEDFRQLPTVTKDELIAHGPELIDRRRRPEQLIVSRSSGSSGRFVSVYMDSQNFIEQELQVIRMLQEFYPGYRPTDLELLVYTSEYPVRSIGGFYRVHYIHNLQPLPHIFAEMRRLRPAIVAIYPSILREIAGTYGAECATLGIKAIVTNSEQASQEERSRLAAIFGCPIFDEYSSEEISSIAHQCAHYRYHLVQDCSVVELLQPDGDAPAASGEWGEIVGTCLINRAMPIIRYRQGDMARLSGEACGCGKSAPFFAELAGRKNASFKRRGAPDIPSGRILDWSYDLVLALNLDVREFQITQVSLSFVRVSLVAGERYRLERDNPAVARSFRAAFGHEFDVAVEVVPAIRKTSSGKHIPILSLVGRHDTSDNVLPSLGAAAWGSLAVTSSDQGIRP